MVMGGIIGYGIKTVFDTIATNRNIDKLNERLDEWQKLENKKEEDKKPKLKF
jgi:hypothetical protein